MSIEAPDGEISSGSVSAKTLPSVLIVDDHELVRRTLRALVESRPEWRVCGEAADGIEAIEKAKQFRPQVILMDINMPRMDGLEATRVIRRELPDSSVILVTQNHETIAREQARIVDAKGSVTKSKIPRDLLPTIEKVLGSGVSEAPGTSGSDERAEWLPGGGALGKLVHEFNWSETPLGPMDQWPQSLTVIVRAMLTSRFAMWMSWGPELTFLYNDAYAKMTLGKKHPWALGKPSQKVWEEIWDDIGPRIRGVLDDRRATWDEGLLLFLERSGYREESYHTFSYSPLSGDDGKVAGHLCVVTEETDRVIGERRLRTLRSLAAEMSKTITEADVLACISRTLGENQQDLPFTVTYLLAEDGKQARIGSCSGITAGEQGAPEVIDLTGQNEVWPISEVLTGKGSIIVENLSEKFQSVPSGSWEHPPSRALLLPLTTQKQGIASGVIVAALNPYRPLDVSYAGFINLLAGQVGAGIANARAYELEKKRAEALSEIDRAKTMFFSNVSHEFRTPLTLMLGPLEDLLAESSGLAPEQRERLDVAHRNSLRLLKLVNTLLDFSRIEAGRIQATYEPTDLATLTSDLAAVFRSAIERGGLRLLVDCPQLSEPVYVDREMWEKIVFNLLSNAYKFTFSGEIEVSLRQRDRHVELTVRDTGTGIPQEELPHLFERFYRIKGSRGRTFEGSGIGLALVQELASLHKGSISVSSKLNQGTTFSVSIPLGSEHLPADRLRAERPLESATLSGRTYFEEALHWTPGDAIVSDELPLSAVLTEAGRPRPGPPVKAPVILLADDNADMREYVRRLLSQQYEVVTVSDGLAALESARQRAPDVILSDVMMPQMDGFALLQAVRNEERLKSVPFILLSARAGEESRIEGLHSGADDYLVKPFSARELLARVKSQLTMQQIRKEAAEVNRKLRLDSELLASIVVSSDDAIVSKSLEGTITSWNQSAERIFGYTAKEAVGQHITLIIPPERRDEENEILARLRRGERVDHFSTVRQRKDGTRIDVSLTISPLRDPTGRVIGASKVARDVTAERRAEEKLRESEERFRAIVDTTPECVKLVAADGTLLHMNASGLHMVCAHSLQDVAGKSIYPLVAPEWRETFRTFNQRVCGGKKGSLEFEIIGLDGKRRFVETHAAPLRNSDGVMVQLAVTRDVTERRLAEEREWKITADAIAANAKFRAVFEQTSVFAGIMTNEGVLIEANKLCLDVCGYRTEEVLSRPFWATPWWRNFAESREKIKCAIPRVAQGARYREELRYSWADGSEHIVDFALYPIIDDAGRVLFLHPTGVDVTELKRTEHDYKKLTETLEAEVHARTIELEQRNADVLRQSEQLRQLSWRLLRAQDEERRHIARELHDSAGQTLAVLGMNVAMLVQTAGRNAPALAAEAERIQETVQQLHREIRTASYLLHPPLLDESGLDSALSWYTHGLMERSGLEITLSIEEDFGRLPRDMELMVFRLVQECLTNIHRHSESKTAVIRVGREEGKLSVEVRDQGRGIPADRLAEIQSRGSGVGIRGMQERVRQFNGKMTIHSDPSGTQISVSIPIPKTDFPEEGNRSERLPAAV
jgi:PAS domain S-box-containing protein